MGDFNAQIGRRNPGEESIMGNSYFGTRNKRGELLINYAISNQLKIGNSFFHKHNRKLWTWKSPKGTTHQLDYMLFSNLTAVKDVEPLNNFLFDSDHRIIRAKLEINKQEIRKKMFKNKDKIRKIFTEEEREIFEIKLNRTISNIPNSGTIQEQYDALLRVIQSSTSYLNSGGTNSTPESKVSEGTMILIKKREAFKRIKNKSPCQNTEFVELKKLVKRRIREDINKYNLKLADQIINNTGSIKRYKKETHLGRQWTTALSREDNLKYNRKEIVLAATDFYKNLYSSKISPPINCHLPLNNNTEENVPTILKHEVEFVIDQLKNNKSPGEDGITNETIKNGKNVLVPILTNIYNRIITEEEIPIQWTMSHTILLHKKGNKTDIKNYRPISLIPVIFKIFTSILQKRLYKKLDEYQPTEQAGFRKGYSTIEHLHTLNQAIEKAIEYRQNIYIAFVDFNKAFDSIEHHSLWTSLETAGIESKYIRILRKIYENSKATIKMERSGPPYKLERGVRQGDPLSPFLFNCALQNIFQKLPWEENGILVQGKHLNNIRFADDVTLFAKSAEELQKMLTDLQYHSRQSGLEFNTSKTSILTNGLKTDILLEGKPLQYVEEAVYLGQIVSFNDKYDKEIQRRIALAWQKYWSLKDVMKANIGISVKRRVFDSCILPCLTYGCQTWALTKRQKSKIQMCQRSMERSMLGITLRDKIPTFKIRKRTKIKEALNVASKLKWSWAGHVIRGCEDRWSKLLTIWQPRYNIRRRGRPYKRWTDDIISVAGSLWSREAQDRDQWRLMGEAYTHQWACS